LLCTAHDVFALPEIKTLYYLNCVKNSVVFDVDADDKCLITS